jgi:prepilin-type N-terminal cleavage/methylation domain-containing protein
MAPSSARRSGFTLVELLAVIMIIALLAGLVTPAVMRAMSSARTAAVKAEIDLLHMALVNYKNEYGSFPPADMRGLWNDSSGSVNPSHPAYKHLKRVFPRIAELEAPMATALSPYYFMAQMSPAQALVFWLQGFYDNPQNPLTNGIVLTASNPRSGDLGLNAAGGTVSGSRKKLFDFDDSRLMGAIAYFQAKLNAATLTPNHAAQTFTPRNSSPTVFARDYPVYFPKQANTGLPYVYFPSSTYSADPTNAVSETLPPATESLSILYYEAVSTTGNPTQVAPYFTYPYPAQHTWAQLHVNSETFQLIAAGADGTYGDRTAAFPGAFLSLNYKSQSVGPFYSVAQEQNTPGHADNITNFANGTLKEAAAKLLNP